MGKEFKLERGFVVKREDGKFVLVWNNKEYGPYRNIKQLVETEKNFILVEEDVEGDNIYITGKKLDMEKDWVCDYILRSKESYIFVSSFESSFHQRVFDETGKLVMRFIRPEGDIETAQVLRKPDITVAAVLYIDDDGHETRIIADSKNTDTIETSTTVTKLLDCYHFEGISPVYVYEDGWRVIIENEKFCLRLNKGKEYKFQGSKVQVYNRSKLCAEIDLKEF
jgi:hypothetical protein